MWRFKSYSSIHRGRKMKQGMITKYVQHRRHVAKRIEKIPMPLPGDRTEMLWCLR
jgi:hypothetical protein